MEKQIYNMKKANKKIFLTNILGIVAIAILLFLIFGNINTVNGTINDLSKGANATSTELINTEPEVKTIEAASTVEGNAVETETTTHYPNELDTQTIISPRQQENANSATPEVKNVIDQVSDSNLNMTNILLIILISIATLMVFLAIGILVRLRKMSERIKNLENHEKESYGTFDSKLGNFKTNAKKEETFSDNSYLSMGVEREVKKIDENFYKEEPGIVKLRMFSENNIPKNLNEILEHDAKKREEYRKKAEAEKKEMEEKERKENKIVINPKED